MHKSKLRVAVLCGGPSPERGISLNSARSLCDHLQSATIEIVPIFFDLHCKPYLISTAQLYSNTPSDFDFKLHQSAKPLKEDGFDRILRDVDIVFPAMHGNFGEDGRIQAILEEKRIPFIGSDAKACKQCFDKYLANESIKQNGFFALPSIVLEQRDNGKRKRIREFFTEHKLKRAIVKPASGGSSIGVSSVSDPAEALKRVEELFEGGYYSRVVVEKFCEGIEFTAVILQNRFGLPVCLLPIEIEADYRMHQIFDYRKKYLPTKQVAYHCPPRFKDALIESIQVQAEQLFTLFHMRDFARFDGWVLPDGKIWFSDFNPISGMEQNSFLFLQAARIGMSHRDVLYFILKNACDRYGINFSFDERTVKPRHRKKINVIFGGRTAERHVSVMSGTNVWLKLMQSNIYDPRPYLFDVKGHVWELTYPTTLYHTVEEISYACQSATMHAKREKRLREQVLKKLAPYSWQTTQNKFIPTKLTLKKFLKQGKIAFNGMHGGFGEDGTLQALFDSAEVRYNGSGAKASRLCMDKYETGKQLEGLESKGIYVANRMRIEVKPLQKFKSSDFTALWGRLRLELGGRSFIVKPIADGCSAGIVRLYSSKDLKTYIKLLLERVTQIPKNTLTRQSEFIEMPVDLPRHLLFEEFIETDRINVVKGKLVWKKTSNWVEVTIGVLGKKGKMKALNPSITVASGDVLSVEEKFQGGTGINITPPPKPYVSSKIVMSVRKKIEIVARVLGLSGYARIDAFMNTVSGDIIVIEANTLPALTPSTVLFHQALAEPQPMYPQKFLEKILDYA